MFGAAIRRCAPPSPLQVHPVSTIVAPDADEFGNILELNVYDGLHHVSFLRQDSTWPPSRITFSMVGKYSNDTLTVMYFSKLLTEVLVPLFEPWFWRDVLVMELPSGRRLEGIAWILDHAGRLTNL